MKSCIKIIIIIMCIFTIYSGMYTIYAKDEEGSRGLAGEDSSEAIDVSGRTPKKKSTWSSKSEEWWTKDDPDVEEDKLAEIANIVATVIRNIGVICAVIVLMVIGFKEMTCSAEEKSILKQALPVYILGVVMIVVISALPSIIYNIVKSI